MEMPSSGMCRRVTVVRTDVSEERTVFLLSAFQLLVTANFVSSSLIFITLVVRLPGCRPRGPGFDSRRYHIF
jgi:hypothetical protein